MKRLFFTDFQEIFAGWILFAFSSYLSGIQLGDFAPKQNLVADLPGEHSWGTVERVRP
jgi:hypothetical protein